jgi:hypothetical protein
MASSVIVRIKGKTGIDEADRLLADLSRETRSAWRHEHSPDSGALSGVGELLLTAVISGAAGKGAELTAEATVDRVRAVIRRWRDRRLDPPDVDVETRAEPEDESGAGLAKTPTAGESED